MRKMLRMLCAATAGLFIFTGCSSDGNTDDEVLTAKEFKTAMEEQGLSVTDQTESASDNSYQQIYVAVDEEKYSFEYYFMKDPNSAANVFAYAKDNLDNTYADAEDAEIAESGSGSDLQYSVDASDYYCEVIQKENAVLYVTAYPDYKEEAAAIIDSLGY